jgi:hypothetical protein
MRTMNWRQERLIEMMDDLRSTKDGWDELAALMTPSERKAWHSEVGLPLAVLRDKLREILERSRET